MHKLANTQLDTLTSLAQHASACRPQPNAYQTPAKGHPADPSQTPNVDTNESRARQPSLSGPALGSSQAQYQPTALECAQAEQGVP